MLNWKWHTNTTARNYDKLFFSLNFCDFLFFVFHRNLILAKVSINHQIRKSKLDSNWPFSFHTFILARRENFLHFLFFIESTIRIFFWKITFYYCLCSLTIALVIFTLKFLSNWQLSYLNFKIHKLFHSSICWKKRVRFQVRAKKNYEWWKFSRAFGRLWKISSGIIFLRTQACWNVEGAWNGEELSPCAFKILMLDEGKQIHKRDEQLRQSRLEENIFRINLFCFFVKRWVIKSLKPKVSLTLNFL